MRSVASGCAAGRPTRLLYDRSSVSRTSSPLRWNVEWHDGSAQLVWKTFCTLAKDRMPLRFAQAPSLVHASASAIGWSQSCPWRGHFELRTARAFTLPLGLFTQQIFACSRPHVLRASHLRTDFLQVFCRVAFLIADRITSFAHFT